MQKFLSYTPNELTFGTSGLRGLVSDMTDIEVYINTLGFLNYLESFGELSESVCIAGDLRSSTPRIMKAVARAIQDHGQRVIHCGFIPTPALAYYAQKEKLACIMVTGSHIPDDRNGIKFYKVDGEVLKSDEASIKQEVATVRAKLYDSGESVFMDDGSLRSSFELDEASPAAEVAYKQRYTDVFSANLLSEKKVVLYQHSAVGRDLMAEVLTSLGAQVICVGRSERFIPIDTENVTPEDQNYFAELANKHKDIFAIVSTDGDGDRPFVVDEHGIFHRGDDLGAIVSVSLQADFATYPISSSDGVDEFMTRKNIEFVHTKIGSPHVIVAMQDALKAEKRRVVGWEVNGGFLIGNTIDIDGVMLDKLPTRDALFPILYALKSAVDAGDSISQLFDHLPARFTQAGMLDDFPVEVSKKLLDEFSQDTAENRSRLTTIFTDELGFGNITRLNSTDGIRIYFDNDVIAHVRPSGNAPQLRIYSVASSQEKADEIVKMGLREPDGILRCLERIV